MKKSFFVFAAIGLLVVATIFISCNQNNPDDTMNGGDHITSQHQPNDPATWSPDKKLFVSTDSSKYGDSIDVIAFWNSKIASFYRTDIITYDARDGYYNMFYNLPCYPNITLTNGNVKYHMTFKDTLTLYWDSLDITYKYYPDYVINY